MGPVAEGPVLGLLAVAEPDFAVLGGDVNHGTVLDDALQGPKVKCLSLKKSDYPMFSP